MVVGDLDVIGIPVEKPKADAPLVIDGDRMLPFPVSVKLMEPIPWRKSQLVDVSSQVDVFQLSRRSLRDVRRDLLCLAGRKQLLGVPVRKRLDHPSTVICHVTRVKHLVTPGGGEGNP